MQFLRELEASGCGFIRKVPEITCTALSKARLPYLVAVSFSKQNFVGWLSGGLFDLLRRLGNRPLTSEDI